MVELGIKPSQKICAKLYGRTADLISGLNFPILDERGYLLLTQTGGLFLLQLIGKLSERTSIIARKKTANPGHQH
ncbi:hypothetical protein [Ruegeria atlantica]|uniref:hypothetical protein n=1 Tax=Ruegeria atlantica TaxID=81569 RepID=UPI00147DF740|nr:hypothetical protein [Ruegeria atlantica]